MARTSVSPMAVFRCRLVRTDLPPSTLFRERRGQGDWEQTEPGLLAIANYLEMYFLGPIGGVARQQEHVFNRFDPCCFSGRKHELFESAVLAAVNRLGDGTSEAYADDTHRAHAISPHATQMLLAWLSRDVRTSAPPRRAESARRDEARNVEKRQPREETK